MVDFSHRSQDLEIMDNLRCSGEVVNQTLRELEIINQWLGGNKVTLQGIQHLIKGQPHKKALSVVDLGCGGGDILKLILAWGEKHKVSMQLMGVDANPHIIDFASAHSRNHPGIIFETTNVLSEDFQKRKFDIVLATLFTHHFSDDQLVAMLKALKHQAKIGIVINDIHRHWLAFHSIRILTRLFSKSTMVKFDAPLSVLRAFRRNELEFILAKAEIKHYRLRWKWAFRWQLIIPAS